jgi:hypothetical protein
MVRFHGSRPMNFSRATARSDAKNSAAPAVSRWRVVALAAPPVRLTARPPISIALEITSDVADHRPAQGAQVRPQPPEHDQPRPPVRPAAATEHPAVEPRRRGHRGPSPIDVGDVAEEEGDQAGQEAAVALDHERDVADRAQGQPDRDPHRQRAAAPGRPADQRDRDEGGRRQGLPAPPAADVTAALGRDQEAHRGDANRGGDRRGDHPTSGIQPRSAASTSSRRSCPQKTTGRSPPAPR